MPYERDNIARLSAYTPGEQPAATQRVIKLNTNENPYPPCEPVMAAIRDVSPEALRRYPSPRAATFRETAARVHGLSPEHVIATNGGDELLRLAISVFCEPRANDESGGAGARNDGRATKPPRAGIGVCEPSYSLYPVLAAAHDTPVTRVPLDDDFALPADLASRWLDAGVGLAMVVNPHAPSGRLQPRAQLADLAATLQGRAVLLIDEAYVDFADHDALPLLTDTAYRGLDNVLLLRTLSKGYSLAGLRFGYGLGHPTLIAALDKARDSYNTDAVSQAAAVAALQHRDQAAETWRRVIDERQRLTAALRDRGFTVLPSASNFVLASPPGDFGGLSDGDRPEKPGAAAATLYESLKARAILVRYFDQDRLRDRLRITVGSPDENNALLSAIDELASREMTKSHST